MGDVVAITGEPPAGLAPALAARGLGIAPDAPALLVCGPLHASDLPARAVLVLADVDEETAVRWIDRGIDVAPARAGAPLVAARLAARLRGDARPLVVGPLSLDPLTRTATRDGVPLRLLPREFALLDHLARTPGRVVPREELLRRVWGLAFDPGTNVVPVHVSRLRARLDRSRPPLIETVRGVGYRLRCP